MEDKFKGCLLAAACGDALGYTVEFSSYESIISMFGDNGIQEMYLRDGVARISDDTQMSIYTAQGLIHSKEKKCDYQQTLMEIYKSYIRWYALQQKYIPESKDNIYTVEEIQNDDIAIPPYRESLSSHRAPGMTCLSALESGKFGSRTVILNDSKGCGGIMRVAPIALAYCNDPDTAYNLACDASLLTHTHILGYTPSGALMLILIKLFSGIPLQDAVSSTINELRFKPECKTLVPVLEQAVQLVANKASREEAYRKLGGGWVAEETLAIAIWAALTHPTDLRKAVALSVNHSGDSDSTGCVCGAIMGAALGTSAIPKSWLENLELKKLIIKQVEQLSPPEEKK